MTGQEIAARGPARGAYLRRFRGSFGQDRAAAHFDTYCRGPRSDLPRKSVEPIALSAGTAVRTLREFRATARWDHAAARDAVRRHARATPADMPGGPLGPVGVVDETSCRKSGRHTPGVRRQYLGCVGKIDDGIVTVHPGVARGTFPALPDADLYLPKSWADDRPRCRDAGIPDDVRHRPKWRLAVDQWLRAGGHGVSFDWSAFDEGYGAAVPFLRSPNPVRRRLVAEVPVDFTARDTGGGSPRRADGRRTAADARGGTRHRVAHRTVRASLWRAAPARVWVAGREHARVAAVNESTAEVKYFLTNATTAPLSRVPAVAFRRWAVEHAFRLGKQEAGLMDYEGRGYTGPVRHLTLAPVVLGVVVTHTERLRGGKPGRDRGAGVPGAEPAVRGGVPPAARGARGAAHQRAHPVSPAAERSGRQVPQEAAA